MRNSRSSERVGLRADGRTWPRAIRRLLWCRRGFGTIELAFAAPVFLVVICGVIELAMMMLVATLMEGGLREAARFGITGYHPPGSTRESYILDTIESNAIGLIDMETAEVTYLVYPSFGDIGQPEPFTDGDPANGVWDAGEAFVDINGNGTWDADMGEAGLGGPGEVVLYTVAVDWSMLTPVVAPLVGEDGKIRMEASVAVRNELWPIEEGS